METSVFRVGITRDFLKPDGTSDLDNIAGPLFDEAGLPWEYLAENTLVLTAAQVRDYDALLVLGPGITAETFIGADRLTVVARFGVGYDKVDVKACTEKGVLLTIAPEGVRRPVATSIMTFVLALSHRLLIKDQLTRSGGWKEGRDQMGIGLVGRVLGLVGVGNIGREVFKVAEPFGMRHIAFDPYVTSAEATKIGIELVNLQTLMSTADFVCICCPLTAETRGLINARCIGLMKPTVYLINTARGQIIDQNALTTALRNRRIQGAALDVFEQEPVSDDDPLLSLDTVIVTPHSICWTDECFQGNTRSACESIIRVASGQIPAAVVNREVTETPQFQQKLAKRGVN